jgi:beta-alanine--pyruvate transaminase
MGANTVAASDSQHHWHPFTSMRTFRPEHMMMQRARDCWVWDAEGREYLDAFAGLWSVNAGHNHPRIVEAIIAQVTEMCAAPLFGRSHPTAAVLSARLAQICPGTLDRVFFSVQGSHAVETALKMSRQFWRAAGRGGKFKIISRERAYHGTAFGGTTAQGIAANRAPFEPLVPGFSHISAPCKFPCDLDCAAELEREILLQGPETVAAFIAEPVVGTGGVIPAPDGYMNKVADICRTYDVLFIVDEVMTGFGRTGPMLAIEHSGVEPDIVILSKGLTSGHLPMAATVTTGGVYSTILDGAARSGVEFPTGATFDGYPAGCAAALANLDVFQEENLLQRSESSGRYLQGSLSELAASKRVGQVRGVGMVAGIELVEPIADKICAEAFARGVIVRPLAGNHVIAVAPPLTIGHDSIDRAVTVLRDSIVAVR